MPQLPRVLNYHGSKYSLAPWIIKHMPVHECYVDSFGGSGSMFCTKVPVEFEVYNDAGRDVSTFFQVIREQPEKLAYAISMTPWSRDEFALSWEPTEDALETARRFMVRSWQSRGTAAPQSAKGRWKAGWRFQRQDSRGGLFIDQWGRLPEALLLFAHRMLQVQIENDHAIKVIQRYDSPTTLHMVDPPYLPDVRSKWAGKAYEVEMVEEEHVVLADTMNEIEGYALICGYPSSLYTQIYESRGWVRVEKQVLNMAGKPATEALWLSPRTIASLRGNFGPLFNGGL